MAGLTWHSLCLLSVTDSVYFQHARGHTRVGGSVGGDEVLWHCKRPLFGGPRRIHLDLSLSVFLDRKLQP
jgi:hypothetical protein